MPTISPLSLFEATNFNILCGILGASVLLYTLVQTFVRQRLFLNEALISLLLGLALGPYGANLLRPLSFAGDATKIDAITLSLSRLVLGVHLLLAGLHLSKNYLRKEWKPLSILLGPGMVLQWGVVSALIYWIVPGVAFILTPLIAACLLPTDPLLLHTLLSSTFGEKHTRARLSKLLIAESGLSIGLAYPLLFIPLYIIKFTLTPSGVTAGLSSWLLGPVTHGLLLSCIYGAIVGWGTREVFLAARRRNLVDYSSLQIISISLAVFIVGTCGLLGGDDVLACFIAGGFLCVDQVELFAPVERKENGIMGVVRMVVFLWAGMVAPWGEFVGAEGMGLMGLGVTVLVLKRLPGVMGLRKWVLPFEEAKEATVLGLVAPIGVSSIAYLIVMTDFLREMAASKELSGESRQLVEQAIRVGGMVVWGVVVVTVIGYGITIPLIMFAETLMPTVMEDLREQVSAGVQKAAGFFGIQLPRDERMVGERGVLMPGSFQAGDEEQGQRSLYGYGAIENWLRGRRQEN
ncbi:Cation/H+ exchanger [Pyronema domesticum]|nr:Cation/H+ exchanger [Pyronema domesticum]